MSEVDRSFIQLVLLGFEDRVVEDIELILLKLQGID